MVIYFTVCIPHYVVPCVLHVAATTNASHLHVRKSAANAKKTAIKLSFLLNVVEFSQALKYNSTEHLDESIITQIYSVKLIKLLISIIIIVYTRPFILKSIIFRFNLFHTIKSNLYY